MIALDLSQHHCQVLLITCLKFTKNNANYAKKKRKMMSECRLIGLKNNELYYKCKECNNESYESINGLIKKFSSIYQFCNSDLNKFVLLLRKGIDTYEDMDSWEKFNETSLPDKKAFYSKLNEEDITDKDYAHAQNVWEVFEIKNRGEYQDLYVQCGTLLLVDVFENFRDNVLRFMNLIQLIFSQLQD